MTADFILAIDQGTTSTRAIIFDRLGRPISRGQREHRQIFPRAGWVEHDPLEIWDNTRAVIGEAIAHADLKPSDVAGIGITNQRETCIVWDRKNGVPVCNAIVWQDTRTQHLVDEVASGEPGRFRDATGLPLATYFSASKLRWILDEVPDARERAENGELAFGTPDSWLLWNLTGGPDGGIHATDTTNASRTLLMNLATLDWDANLLNAWQIPLQMMPEIRSSSEVYGSAAVPGLLGGVPVSGILGDQQAATFGQTAFEAGESKNTYGTGNFVIVGTGAEIVHSTKGLLTTVAYQLGGSPARFALEGSIAVTGSLIQWLRDNLGIIANSADVEALANSVPDTGDVYFVPAFSGLFAPYWRPDARGAIVGLTRFANKAHIARAALEATAFQTADVIEAMNAETGTALTEVRVDGGMVANNTLMQFQADVLGIPVIRPAIIETTALGAAYAAGLAVGFWSGFDQLRENWQEDHRWHPNITTSERKKRLGRWHLAVERSLNWA